MSDLKIHTTQSLIDELQSRHKHSVFVGQRSGLKGKKDAISKHWDGDLIMCCGLVMVAEDFVTQAYRETYKDIDENEI